MNSLKEFEADFLNIRFPEGIVCPRCNGLDFYELKGKQYKCASCYYRFRVLTGTFLEKYKISLESFFFILVAFIESWPGEKVAAETQLTLKTIYKCLHDVRLSLVSDLPEEKRKLFIKKPNMREENEMLFGVIGREKAEIIPLPELTYKIVNEKIKKKDMASLERYIGFITKKGTIRTVEPEYIQTPVKAEIIDFIGYFFSECEDQVSKNQLRIKNFALYLKGREFIYNNRELSTSEVIQKLLRKLIPPIYPNNISIFSQLNPP